MRIKHVCAPILDPNSNKLFVLSCQMLSLGKLGEKYNGFAVLLLQLLCKIKIISK